MKKKLILSFIALFASSVFLIRANAAITTTTYPPLFNKGWDTQAKVPNNPPSSTDDVYATITEDFDFSKVIFKTTTGTMAGKDDLKKIIIGKFKNNAITTNNSATKSLDDLFSSWWTAYCLDANKKYPEYGLFNYGGSKVINDSNGDIISVTGYTQAVLYQTTYGYDNTSDEEALQFSIANAAILNAADGTGLNHVADVLASLHNPGLVIQFTDRDSTPFPAVSMVSLTSGKTMQDYYQYFMGQTTD